MFASTKLDVFGRENRNMYARLLLHMLKRGVLEGPFNQSPEHGELKTLPSYMVGGLLVCVCVCVHARACVCDCLSMYTES